MWERFSGSPEKSVHSNWTLKIENKQDDNLWIKKNKKSCFSCKVKQPEAHLNFLKFENLSVTLWCCEISLNLEHLSMHLHVVSTFHIFCRRSASQGTKTQLADARRLPSSVSRVRVVTSEVRQCVHVLFINDYESSWDYYFFFFKFSTQFC